MELFRYKAQATDEGYDYVVACDMHTAVRKLEEECGISVFCIEVVGCTIAKQQSEIERLTKLLEPHGYWCSIKAANKEIERLTAIINGSDKDLLDKWMAEGGAEAHAVHLAGVEHETEVCQLEVKVEDLEEDNERLVVKVAELTDEVTSLCRQVDDWVQYSVNQKCYPTD